jgi:tRNA-2-methylthio-N6-dimethylallyladenosine synthase
MVTRTCEVRTHGCQMNVHDSERIGGLLDEAGYAPVADGAQPDVVVFSTCAVRENADNKSTATSATSRSAASRGLMRWSPGGLANNSNAHRL